MRRAIIIGSGLSGLASAVILARHGYGVTVVEQGSQPGGCLQCFVRDGVKFETGIHYVGSVAPGQFVHRVLDYLGVLADIRLSPLDPEGYNVISLGGERYAIASGRDALIASLVRHFPGEADSLDRFYRRVEQVGIGGDVGELFAAPMPPAPGQPPTAAGQAMAAKLSAQLVSIGDVLDATVGDARLRDVLCGDQPLYAGVRERTPWALYGQLFYSYNQSAQRIVGGSDTVARSLIATLGRLGGEVRTRCAARRVATDTAGVTGVEVATGELLPADVVVSAIHPQRLLPMVASPLLRPAYRQRVASIPNTPSVFSLYLRFKPGAMPYMNSNFFGYRGDSPWGCEHYDAASWPKNYFYMHFCHADRPQWAQGGVALSYMQPADVAPWAATTSPGHRGEAYEAWKRQKAERMLDMLEADHPGLRAALAATYTASPLTYRDYTGTTDGSIYGIVKDVTQGPAYRIACRTKVPGLWLTGQNTNSHGMLGVLVSSIITCSAIVGHPIDI